VASTAFLLHCSLTCLHVVLGASCMTHPGIETPGFCPAKPENPQERSHSRNPPAHLMKGPPSQQRGPGDSSRRERLSHHQKSVLYSTSSEAKIHEGTVTNSKDPHLLIGQAANLTLSPDSMVNIFMDYTRVLPVPEVLACPQFSNQ